MWKIISVNAKNLCAFKELEYLLKQDCTTLVFGNNMDNDSQGSNGSGKSALLEAIAIGLTGEPLRKIKMDEIINDAEDESEVNILMMNQIGTQIAVNRKISRKKPQDISITIIANDGSEDIIKQATVADYNKYVLDTIGLSKDDLYANFILSKNKYASFLSCSDREKKEIINRFSNGNLVDESIDALKADIAPIEESLLKATTEVAVAHGRVDTISQQLKMALEESDKRLKKQSERIEGWKQSIAEKRAYIRKQRELYKFHSDMADKFNACESVFEQTENSDKSLAECYGIICREFDILKHPHPTNYVAQIANKQNDLKALKEELSDLLEQADEHNKALESAKSAHANVQSMYEKFQKDFDAKQESIKQHIEDIQLAVQKLEADNVLLNNERMRYVNDIADINKQLAGVIVCPKCQHEFSLAVKNINTEDLKSALQDRQKKILDIESALNANNQAARDYDCKKTDARNQQTELNDSQTQWRTKTWDSQVDVTNANNKLTATNNKIAMVNSEIVKLSNDISDARIHLFDDAYELLDSSINTTKCNLQSIKMNINDAEGSIQSLEEFINDAKESSEDIINNLKTSLQNSELELADAVATQESIQKELNIYKEQESTFIEFKTHLANTKIAALSYITNQFLEKIGSDIKISLSGYTILKSGKVRDKISISLLRDGIDCGSFDKFSAGERARVELATILAMNNLTNSSCDNGKGLDLLVLDEILEAVDEQGLRNIFNALNQLKITSLVVSHGNIAENYPYKIVVNKLNGTSFINNDKQ